MSFDRHVVHTEEDYDLYLTAIPEDPHRSAEAIWEPDEDFVAVVAKLTEKLRQNRGRGLEKKIAWDPIAASNGTLGALPTESPLVEIAGHDDAPWYLTDDGINHPA